MARTLLWNLLALELCRLIRISENGLILCKINVEPSHFHVVIEIGNICFMLKIKSFSGSQSSEVFDEILFD